MKQIRIYYESLEQAENYIKPIIESVIDKSIVEVDAARYIHPRLFQNNGWG